jgi:hypothetical protein
MNVVGACGFLFAGLGMITLIIKIHMIVFISCPTSCTSIA